MAALPIDPPDQRRRTTRRPRSSEPSATSRSSRRSSALAPDHRTIVVMKEFDDLRYEEIAAMLGIPVGTVRSRLHRARCELRERLRGLMDDDLPVRSQTRRT